MPAVSSGTAAAATNTKWQERMAADVTRACSWSRPRRLRRRARARRPLSACEDRCAGHAPRANRRERSPASLGSTCFCRAEAENRGAWVHRSWHRTAPTSLLFPKSAPNAFMPPGFLVQLGCAIATASAPSVLGAGFLIRRGRGRRRAPAATAQ